LSQGGSRPSRGRAGTIALASLAVWALILAGCSGGGESSSSDETADDTTTTSIRTVFGSTTIPAAIQEPPEDVIDLFVPIETANLGVIRLDETLVPPDYLADDSFNRCEVYTTEMLTALLNRRFDLTFSEPGTASQNGTCTWITQTEGGASVFAVVRLAQLPADVIAGDARIDPTMQDGAAEVGDILRIYPWADPVWELDASTFGPGTAFRKDSIIGQTNIFITDAEDLVQAAFEERQAELILAQNLALRLEF